MTKISGNYYLQIRFANDEIQHYLILKLINDDKIYQMSTRPMDEQKCPLDIQMSARPLDEWTNGHCLMATTLVSYPHRVRLSQITSLQLPWRCKRYMSIGHK